MSERGSFVTEFVYCKACFEACKKVLLGDHKYLMSVVIPSPGGQEYPIIAGKIGGLSAGEELVTMEFELKPRLDERLCHPIRIAVLAENGNNEVVVCGPELEIETCPGDAVRITPAGTPATTEIQS